MRQVVFRHFFSYSKHRFWGFTQMQRAHAGLQQCKGLQFYKMLGTGAGAGFSLRPDFSTYALLTVWDTEQCKLKAFDKAAILQAFFNRSAEQRIYSLSPIHTHGNWSGQSPFEVQKPLGDKPIGVITRATLNPTRLLEFWRHVPQASRAIKQAKGVGFFKGIGEWPFVQQATFSVWESAEAIRTFAYVSQAHASIVKKTRQRKWYKEDMFNRFEVLSEEKTPLI
ncbi:MAG: spheroidene monooxygenase [Bacteroidota bacterium]|nr:spheroidene monooxygenase [Bacteroidota bacterium]